MLRKVKKIDNIYHCVLSSSTTEQEVKMAEGFLLLLPLSGIPGVTSPYRHLPFKSCHRQSKQLFIFILSLLPPPRRLCDNRRLSAFFYILSSRETLTFEHPKNIGQD